MREIFKAIFLQIQSDIHLCGFHTRSLDSQVQGATNHPPHP